MSPNATSPATVSVVGATTVPDLSMYRALHDAMRAANDQLVHGIETLPEHDRDRAAALGRWFAGYAGELRSHHHVEDEIFFPAIRDSVSTGDMPTERLLGEHRELDRIIDELTSSFRTLARTDTVWSTTVEVALRLATELRTLLAEHLDVEDDDVLPLLEQRFTAAEYDAMDDKAIKTVPLRQLLFTVPWIMAMSHPEVAARLLADAKPAMRLIWTLTRRRYGRLVEEAFGAQSKQLSTN